MKKITALLFALLTALLLTSCDKATVSDTADLVVHNAIIYTVDKEFSTAEAFAVKDGNFIAVVTNDAILGEYSNAKQTLDARRRVIYPGFNDGHAHFYRLGDELFEVDLRGSKSMGEVIERIQTHLNENPDLEWVLGRGWDQN
ncbi:MAG: amidohydrolase family protein, partial [Bacteroidota bacterium]